MNTSFYRANVGLVLLIFFFITGILKLGEMSKHITLRALEYHKIHFIIPQNLDTSIFKEKK